jgi:hypothetical protein
MLGYYSQWAYVKVDEVFDRAEGEDGPLALLDHGHKFFGENICVLLAGSVGSLGQGLLDVFGAPLGHCDFHRHAMGLVGLQQSSCRVTDVQVCRVLLGSLHSHETLLLAQVVQQSNISGYALT